MCVYVCVRVSVSACVYVCVCVFTGTHMHLRGTASQQVDEGGVEGHDGVAHVSHLLLLLTLNSPVTEGERRGEEGRRGGEERRRGEEERLPSDRG